MVVYNEKSNQYNAIQCNTYTIHIQYNTLIINIISVAACWGSMGSPRLVALSPLAARGKPVARFATVWGCGFHTLWIQVEDPPEMGGSWVVQYKINQNNTNILQNDISWYKLTNHIQSCLIYGFTWFNTVLSYIDLHSVSYNQHCQISGSGVDLFEPRR